jgi:outer membrane protein OmpA-like peptidoglycan-associated protein
MRVSTKVVLIGLAALSLGACSTVSVPGFSRARATRPCQDLTVHIYFQRDSATVTREARAVLKGAGDMARGCQLGAVDVVGLADAVGDPAANLALSQKRADAVKAALARLGFDTVNFQVGAVGEDGATLGGADKPLRRRADVTFHLKPR